MGLECLGARLVPTAGMTWGTLVPTVGMTWGTPRSYGRNIDVGLECLGAHLVPTVGTLTWGLNGNIDVGLQCLGECSFLR